MTFFIDKSHRVFNLVHGVEIFPSGVCAPPFFLRRKSRIFWNFDAINTVTSFPLYSSLICVLPLLFCSLKDLQLRSVILTATSA